jgi:hypothetical protein
MLKYQVERGERDEQGRDRAGYDRHRLGAGRQFLGVPGGWGRPSPVNIGPQWAWGSADPAFELCDGERGLTYWVREIPTPRQATELLEEHGGLPEEERGNPRKNDAVNGEGEHHRRET